MKNDETKNVANSLNELSESYAKSAQDMKGTVREVRDAKKLWRGNNNPALIKIGLALIAFPDPTISDVVGVAFVAAGTVQQGIRRRTMYVDDISKTFQKTMKELRNLKSDI